MRGMMQVLIGSEDLGIWRQVGSVLESRGLGLTRFRSVKEASRALSRGNVLVVFCENRVCAGGCRLAQPS